MGLGLGLGFGLGLGLGLERPAHDALGGHDGEGLDGELVDGRDIVGEDFGPEHAREAAQGGEALHEADAILAMAGVITRERTCAGWRGTARGRR